MRIPSIVAGLAFILITGFSRTCLADSHCVDYASFIHRMGGTETYGLARALAVQGTYAYVAEERTWYGGHPAMEVIEASNPWSPQVVGRVELLDSALDIAVSGSYAYVADASCGLQVIDISNPQSPRVITGMETGAWTTGVAAAGAYAYVASGAQGKLQVVDIANPRAPCCVGTIATPGEARAVAISGSYAYVADWGDGLRIIDVSDPTAPAFAGVVDTPGSAGGVAVSGAYAYVADDTGGLQVVDVSDPHAPRIVATVGLAGPAKDVSVSGSHAFVATAYSGLRAVDISDPTSPRLVGGISTCGAACGVCAVGSRAYVADGGAGLILFDVSNPSGVPRLGNGVHAGDYTEAVAHSGALACIGARGSLALHDLTDPENPEWLSVIPCGGFITGIVIDDGYAYCCCQNYDSNPSALVVVDIRDPRAPVIASTLPVALEPADLALSGDYLCLVTHYYTTGELNVIDRSDPSNPILVSTLGFQADVAGVATEGRYAYLAATSVGLVIVDLLDPAHPTVVSTCPDLGWPVKVAVGGGFAYLVSPYGGLQIVDIQDPFAPRAVAHLSTASQSMGAVACHGPYVVYHEAVNEARVQVVDVTDPERAYVFATVERFGGGMGGNGLSVSDGMILLACGHDGAMILPAPCFATNDNRESEPAGSGGLRVTPNPALAGAPIRLAGTGAEWENAVVYDMSGRVVSRLIRGNSLANEREWIWDGRDARGRAAAPGIYLARLAGGGCVKTGRIVLLR